MALRASHHSFSEHFLRDPVLVEQLLDSQRQPLRVDFGVRIVVGCLARRGVALWARHPARSGTAKFRSSCVCPAWRETTVSFSERSIDDVVQKTSLKQSVSLSGGMCLRLRWAPKSHRTGGNFLLSTRSLQGQQTKNEHLSAQS